MSSVFTLKALGLNLQPNQTEVPPGSLVMAKNINITRSDVIEPRRGFKLYGDSMGSISDVAKQLFSYKLRILRHFSNILQFDDGTGRFLTFSGNFTEAKPGLRTKSAEMNGNLYLTSSDGIKKISALTAGDFSTTAGVLVNAGAIAAVDITGYPNYLYGDQTDFLVQDSAVAYRVVWGSRDNNNNLILGTPSQRIEVYNYLLNLLLPDYMHLLGALDSIGLAGSTINAKNFVSTFGLGAGASATDLYNSLVALVAELDKNIIYGDNYHNLGSWNATTNSPVLHNNSVTLNDTYIVSTAGTIDLGAGSVAYNIGDVVTFNGTSWVVNSALTYKGLWDPNYVSLGNWDANVNIPALTDGIGTPFNFYKVTTGGTQNLGSGSQTFAIGDFVYYTAGGIWLKSTSIIYLQDGSGNTGDLYRVSTVGTHTFTSGTTAFAVNDFISYNGTIWGKNIDLIYLADWNATTNSPIIYSTVVVNGDYYTVGTAGTQDLGAGSIAYALNDRIVFNNGLWVVNNGTIVSGSPLKVSSAVIADGIATITFSSGDPSTFLVSGDTIALTGFNITGITPGININTLTTPISNSQTVASVTTNTLTFNTTLTGLITIDAGANITSNKFQAIVIPVPPAVPATDADLVNLQNLILDIIAQLNSEPNSVIPTAALTAYIAPLTVTKASSVTLHITIPAGITTNDFFQIYRSATFIATGTQVLATDVVPNDELFLVYEAFPTAAEIAAGTITVIDITPDAFLGANLYTNASTGEGILQANDAPPYALDINVFKNSMFYANTHTRNVFPLSLLGVQNMIADFIAGITPTITISTATGTNTYRFVVGSVEEFTITCVAGSALAASGPGSYFDANSGTNQRLYRFWYNIGTAVAPASGGRILIPILAGAADTNATIALKTRDAFNTQNLDFSATAATNVVSVKCIIEGITTGPAAGTSGFTVAVTHAGTGENASANQILLSNSISPAIAVQLTAQSLVRVINQNSLDSIYAYYTSGSQEVPGKLTFQSRTLGGGQFFITTNNLNTGLSFSPALSPTVQITSIAVGTPSTNLVTTATPHGLSNLDFVFISGSNSTPNIDGYQQITYVSPTTFRVNATITNAGTTGSVTSFNIAESSSNNSFPNRIYYSKLQQPEAVPTLNYFDVGARDKEILRIYPLRDSLFIFKQDGVYRISGESIPWNLGLFDSSCILVAPDSVSSVDNAIYGWTRQGIATVTESGARNMSRPIDTVMLPLSSSGYTHFSTATWGIGYESDKSYTVYTLAKTSDLAAVQAFKYNTLTNAWTTIAKDSVCGVINFPDDKMYLGAGDVNFIEQERKNYTREDFADREYPVVVQSNSMGNSIILDTVTNIAPDDVIVQSQPFSTYIFNSLLKKIDAAPFIVTKNFYSTLAAIPGMNLRTQLVALATKLDSSSLTQSNFAASIGNLTGSITAISTGPLVTITSAGHGLISGRVVLFSATNSVPVINGGFVETVIDANTFTIIPGFIVTTAGTTGTWTTVSSDFTDLQVVYNKIISKLNADAILSVTNFQPATTFNNIEVLITAVNYVTKTITVAQNIPFIQGALTCYKAIPCEVIYSPYSFGGDPISLKHIREAQFLFDSLAFTKGIVSFASDLMPSQQEIPFEADGVGLFGLSGPFGSGFFGGGSDSAPIRTLIPRDCQRCRYLVVRFVHSVARDKWALNGITLTGDVLPSSRAYR